MMESLWTKPGLLTCLAVFVFLTNLSCLHCSDFFSDSSIIGSDTRFSDSVQILQGPENKYYVMKNKPATIVCKAVTAARITFKCAEQWLIPDREEDIIDKQTNRKILSASIDVTKEDVEEYFGASEYWCECYAYNKLGGGFVDKDSIKSKRGIIQIAFLKRRFQREPMAMRVEVSRPAQLQCLPPDGKPLPEVYWLKDGVEIDVKNEENFIINNVGALLINQARLADMGNYTCGARNVVTKRQSESATLTVYVNGSWSSWSEWTGCSVKCGTGEMRRQRSCTNPAPINGGAPCPGESTKKADCTQVCPVDGNWGDWSSWSTCSPECQHHRKRACNNPSAAHGGTYCRGKDLEGSNCTGGMCRDHRYYKPDPTRQGTASPTKNEDDNKQNIAMYVGLCVAIVVFGAVVAIIVFLLLRRSQHHHGRNDSNTEENEKKVHKNGHGMVSAQPDLTQQVVIMQHHSTSPSPSIEPPNNNHPPVENIYDKPDININKMEHRLSFGKNGKTVFVEPTINLNMSANELPSPNRNSGPIVPMGVELHQSSGNENMMDNRESIASIPLPNNVDATAVTWGTFSYTGGRLVLPDSGVSLTIPEGAVRKGQVEEIFLGVCREDKDRPKLSDRQTIVGPVIVCGPNIPGTLKKPMILSFQHCASMRQGGWMLALCSSDTQPEESPQWRKTVTLGQENINTQMYVQLDPNQCHIMTEHLQWYTMIGEAVPGGRPVKILRLAAFAPTSLPSMDFSIRVYVVDDTQDALEGVIQEEKKFGGRLLDKPKQIPFQDGGHNLCLTIEELSPGWRSKLAANYQEIPFQHIWSGNQSNLHCSFSLELVDRDVHKISCKIQVYQKAILSNRQMLHVQNNFKDKMTSCSTPSSTLKGRSSTVTTNSSSGFSSMVTLDHNPLNFRLPSHIRHQLCMLLDPPNARGNDWRMLAQALTVDRYVQYFATKKSPTDHILNLWEARHREETAVTDLLNIFRVMGRLDAAAVIEKDIGSWL